MKIAGYVLCVLFMLKPLSGWSQKCGWNTPSLLTATKNSSFHDKANTENTLYIPLVIHSIYHNENQKVSAPGLLHQLRLLNRAFAAELTELETVDSRFKPLVGKTNIQFYLADFDESGQAVDGVNYVQSSLLAQQPSTIFTEESGSKAWPTERYLNVWVANLGGSAYGWAREIGSGAKNGEGVVVDYRWFGNEFPDSQGKTLVHELGHYFGLMHSWGTGGCESDDGIADTPLQAAPAGCASASVSCGSADMTQNFMNDAPDDCLLFFTHGQALAMESNLKQLRPNLGATVAPLGITEGNFDEDFSLRRMGNTLQITGVNGAFKELKLSLYTAQGRLIREEKRYKVPGNQLDVNIQSCRSGLYILCVETGLKIYRKKVLLDNRI